MKISHDDEQDLHRLLDGELAAAAAATLRQRLAAEPALSAHFETLQGLRAGFAAARTGGVPAPAGFTASVLSAARRLPDRRELTEQDAGEGIVRLCRQLLIAAAIVVGLGMVWHSGLLERMFDRSRDDTLQAESNDVGRELQRLDALIQSGRIGERKTK